MSDESRVSPVDEDSLAGVRQHERCDDMVAHSVSLGGDDAATSGPASVVDEGLGTDEDLLAVVKLSSHGNSLVLHAINLL